MDADRWLESRTFHHSRFEDIGKLVDLKKDQEQTVSVAIPTLNEQETIGDEVGVIRRALMEQYPLVDEIIVVDSGSEDKTREEAEKAGACFYLSKDILPDEGSLPGKGENLWKSLWITQGDIIVWLDADIKNIAPKFVYGLVGPLLENPDIGYVKAFYDRPLRTGAEIRPSGGGRVTEILVRPLISLCAPDLAYLMQPLSGEYAGRRDILEALPFCIGYGVETGHLLDLYQDHGLGVLAQVDMDVRIHRNRSIQDLGRMSFGILQTFLHHLAEKGNPRLKSSMHYRMIQFLASENHRIPQTANYREQKRPPIITLDSYRNKRQLFDHSHNGDDGRARRGGSPGSQDPS